MKATLEVINRMQGEGIIGKYAIGDAVGASVAQTSAVEVCGSSLCSRFRVRGEIPAVKICGFAQEEPQTSTAEVCATLTQES